MSDESTNANKTNGFLWVLIACLIFSILGSVGLFVWLSARKSNAVAYGTLSSTSSPPAPTSGKVPASFAELSEADVPGRYKIDDAGKVMYVVLNDDHTFINTDGTTYPPYRWDVTPEGLTIVWQRSQGTYSRFEAPGIYSAEKPNGGVQRMEKLPDLPPADAIVVDEKDVVASLRFTADVQANGLNLANTDNDGAIRPAEAGGEQCHQLFRSRSRMSAFLYARIAPELKAVPFTNALVSVEYFDAPSRDPRNGWITLQYDARDGPYTSTAQRVRLEGSLQWKPATFVLDAPLFNGSQNDGADFRLCVAGPELSVRSIKLLKNTPAR